MALVVKDRVQETSTTTGTGAFTLAGAVAGFQSFSVIGNANTTYYAIVGGAEWEVGLGTYTSSGTSLSRDTILESSNGGTAVNFSAGTKNVFVTYPAEKGLYLDASGNSIGLGVPASITLTNATGLPLSTGVTGTLVATNGGTGNNTYSVGDLLVGGATNTLSKLSDVATGNALISGGVGVSPLYGKIGLSTHVSGVLPQANGGTGTASIPAFSAYQGTSQTINDNTDTKLTINTEDFDTNSNFDTSTYRFTPTVAGYYQIQGAIYFNNQSAYSTVKIFKNGSAVNLGPQNGNGAFTYGSNVSAVIYFNGSTDYVELYAYQNSGISRPTVAGRPYTYFSGALLRAA